MRLNELNMHHALLTRTKIFNQTPRHSHHLHKTFETQKKKKTSCFTRNILQNLYKLQCVFRLYNFVQFKYEYTRIVRSVEILFVSRYFHTSTELKILKNVFHC